MLKVLGIEIVTRVAQSGDQSASTANQNTSTKQSASQTSATTSSSQHNAPPTSATRVSFSTSPPAAYSAVEEEMEEESGSEYEYEGKEDGVQFSAFRVSIEDYYISSNPVATWSKSIPLSSSNR
jgi:hypothetical protein